MRTNIEKELWSKYFPNEEFDYDNFYDWSRENAFELLPLALDFSEKIKQEYADEFACAFADFLGKNYQPRFPNKCEWVKIIDSNKFKTIYTTTELLEIFKKEQDGL